MLRWSKDTCMHKWQCSTQTRRKRRSCRSYCYIGGHFCMGHYICPLKSWCCHMWHPLRLSSDRYVLMRLDGILAKLMVKVNSKMYHKFITTNAKGKSVFYVQLEKEFMTWWKVLYYFINIYLLTSSLLVLGLIQMIHVLQIKISMANKWPYAGMLTTCLSATRIRQLLPTSSNGLHTATTPMIRNWTWFVVTSRTISEWI